MTCGTYVVHLENAASFYQQLSRKKMPDYSRRLLLFTRKAGKPGTTGSPQSTRIVITDRAHKKWVLATVSGPNKSTRTTEKSERKACSSARQEIKNSTSNSTSKSLFALRHHMYGSGSCHSGLSTSNTTVLTLSHSWSLDESCFTSSCHVFVVMTEQAWPRKYRWTCWPVGLCPKSIAHKGC